MVAILICMAGAAPAAAAPLAAGPEVTFLQTTRPVGMRDVAMTPAGDALVVFAARAPCCTDAYPLFVRQRRGPRGAFGEQVRVVPAPAPTDPAVAARIALTRTGDAAIAFARSGGGIESYVRRGWGGAWRRVAVPGSGLGAAPEVRAPILVAAPSGAIDLLWFDQDGAGLDPAGTVRSARLQGGAWRALAPVAVPAARFRSWALAPGGSALVTGIDDQGHVWAASRGAADAPWDPPIGIGAVAATTGPGPAGYPAAAIGRDGSLLASWISWVDPSRPHEGWLARREPGDTAWGSPVSVGPAESSPGAATDRAGNLIVVWPRNPPLSDDGPADLQLLRATTGAPATAPVHLGGVGSGLPSLDDRGGAVIQTFFGQNEATYGGALLLQQQAGAAVREAYRYYGGGVTATTPRYALTAVSRSDGSGPPVIVGIDRLGPLGLSVPPRPRAGGRLAVRLNLWAPARVTVRLRGGEARASVTRALPAGRSVVRLALPAHPGSYLVSAAGRGSGRSALLRQQAVVRVGSATG